MFLPVLLAIRALTNRHSLSSPYSIVVGLIPVCVSRAATVAAHRSLAMMTDAIFT